MTPEELRAAITYANGIDPRVQMTGPNAELWGRAVGMYQAIEVKAAILVYYERPQPPNRERAPIDAASIRKIIQEETVRAEAQQRALEPPKNKAPHPKSFRERNPEEWDRLFQLGADQRRADLASRGIHLPAKGATP